MREGSELLDIIQFSGPEIITVGVKDDSDSVNDSFADNEEMTHGFNFNFSSNSQSHLDLLAQAHCLVSTTPCETPPSKKSKTAEVDPDKDYHQCQVCRNEINGISLLSSNKFRCIQLCGTRVKAPRGGRWNLQMHVMAMHSSHRPYKCQQCDFQDYSTEEKRTEWDSVMGRCFPEFAYRTGFLLDSRPNPTLPNTTTDSSV
uniref:C2H2-type domain-containing protein n=1 Tax=Heterorhabditis bacteriophora TaxID=37862 RepID=A0A1I7WKA9_HETBA